MSTVVNFLLTGGRRYVSTKHKVSKMLGIIVTELLFSILLFQVTSLNSEYCNFQWIFIVIL